MNYNSVCSYIVANGGTVDDKKFRLNQCDDDVFIDRWSYDFKKPENKDLKNDLVAEAIMNDITKKKLEDEFKQWKFYDLLVELIDKKQK